MRFWWVNQNQTYRHELGGGYLWSPKRNANGARNPFYESMREVAPGDLVFSFVDTRIAAISIAEELQLGEVIEGPADAVIQSFRRLDELQICRNLTRSNRNGDLIIRTQTAD